MSYTFPPSNRVIGTPDPAGDMDKLIDILTGAGLSFSVLNTAWAGGADPTGSAFSSAAIQAAMDSATQSQVITFPQGTFKQNATLHPSQPVTILEGSGWGTVLEWDGTLVSPFIGMADTTQRTVILRNLRLANSGPAAAGTAINADYFTSQSVMSGLKIDGTAFHPNVGIDFGVVSTNTHYTALRDSRIQVDGTNAIGLHYRGGGTGAISNVADNVRILISTTDASQTGIVVATRGILLVHPDIESGAGIAIDVQTGGDACTIVAPYLESNGINLQLASGVAAFCALGGTILTAHTSDINDLGALAPKILGVRTTGGVPYDRLAMQQSASAGKILYVINTAATPSDAAVRVDVVSGQQAVAVRNTGDGASRWRVTGSGSHDFGNGSVTPDCHLSRLSAGVMQFTSCDLDISTEGNGLRVKEGATAGRMGTAVLVAGTVTVACTAVTAATRIFLTRQVAGGTTGQLQVGGRSVGVSFTISSSSGTDTSTVAYLLMEPG